MRKRMSLLRFVISALLITSSSIALSQQPQGWALSSEREQKWVTVEGAVKVPMRVEFRRPVRLMEILAMAGGVKGNAKDMILITHADGTSTTYRLKDIKRRDDKFNPYIQAGAIITVAE